MLRVHLLDPDHDKTVMLQQPSEAAHGYDLVSQSSPQFKDDGDDISSDLAAPSPSASTASSDLDSSPSSPLEVRPPSPSQTSAVPSAGENPLDQVADIAETHSKTVLAGIRNSAHFSIPFSNLTSPVSTTANSRVVSSPRCSSTDPHVLQGGSNGVTLLANRYLLLEQVEGSNLHRCIDATSRQEFVCKVIPNSPSGQTLLCAHYRVEGNPFINPVKEVITANSFTYLLFPPCTTDLHSYVRMRRRLKEHHARHLFRQIVSAVHVSHAKGIVLRDLKLRKFVFTSDSRLDIKLESLEDAVILEDESDDFLSDKHGCPAYVSPEILKCNTRYSGRAADMWGLGVMLYTMLVGRYPFHGQEHSGLFAKIRRGHFSLPDSLSSRAKCLIRCLLRKEPEERLTTEDVLIHPWLSHVSSRERGKRSLVDTTDQTVPEKKLKTEEEEQDLRQ